MEIHLIFTQNNKLKVSIFNNQFQHGDFKICFSLVYSIQAVQGGSIIKKVGRYYEISSEQDEIFFSSSKMKKIVNSIQPGIVHKTVRTSA